MDDTLASLAAATKGDRQEPGLAHDLTVARRVIRAEIDGLQSLAGALDGAFGAALDLAAAVTGRLIVTGIGKSGHIAHKIAATLASTGTPAQFIHPAEASHGDLGMIGAGDVVLALGTIAREAKAQRKSLADHVTHLVVHGVLHLMGYDHEKESEALRMERLDHRASLPTVPEAAPTLTLL